MHTRAAATGGCSGRLTTCMPKNKVGAPPNHHRGFVLLAQYFISI